MTATFVHISVTIIYRYNGRYLLQDYELVKRKKFQKTLDKSVKV